ncbi:FtsX-like permease family protein [Nonomuraea sp. NPDC050556]|uniref:FtsX-like permease family protein n=1 Tax=Nonomuraea sp. NPDC050556 TaxID=3364369 RepID=UPI00379DD47E
MFIAIRDIRYAKGRFALMAAVVGLITLLVVLLSGLTAGLRSASVSAIEHLPAQSLLFGSKVSFGESVVKADRTRGEPLGVTQTRIKNGEAITVFGVEPGSFLAPGKLGPGEIIVSPALDLATNQRVTLGADEFTVVAQGPDDSFSHTPVVWATLDDWRTMAHAEPGTATVLALEDASGVSLSDSLAGVGGFSSENSSLLTMQGFLFAISALVIGAFFTVWTVQRQGDIAILKALGASGRYLLRDALAQALIVLALGAGLGGAVGIGLGALAERVMPFTVSAPTTLVPVLAMIVLGMAGAVLAVRRITSVDPLIALGSAR